MPPRVAIIVLNWNGKRDTLECLASLQAVRYENVEVIVVDNGSSDGSAAEIRSQFPKTTLLESRVNLGFAGGNNIGIHYAMERKSDYLLLLNNDTVIDPDILHAFIAADQGGIQGAKTYLYDKRDTLDHLGGRWNSRQAVFDFIGYREIDDGKRWEAPILLDYVCGCAMFVPRRVFETVGLLEPKFFLIWEESDFCFRARRHGFSVQSCPGARLWHKVSASFTGGKPHSTYFWWRGRLLWLRRNLPWHKRLAIYVQVIVPELLQLCKLQGLKRLQMVVRNTADRQEKLARYRAALQGAWDYFCGRFGDAPANLKR